MRNARSPIDRRTVLRATTIAAAGTLAGVAGCLDEDPEDPAAPEDDAAVDEEWEDVDTIELEAHTPGWIGVEPGIIDGEENPTLVLFEGQGYEIAFENADGDNHNLEIRDDDGQIVEDYETDMTEEAGDGDSLQIEASAEMASYVCAPHETTMVGEIDIQ